MLIAIAATEATDREFLEDHLHRWGFTSEALDTGVAALQRVQEPSPPRVVLVSWTLAGPSAEETCRRIRALEGGPRPHIVLLVARPDFHQALEVVAEGLADDFLLRPLDAYSLEARLTVARKALALRGRLALTEAELETQSLRDGLTGLWGRNACLSFLRRELAGSQRSGSPVGAVLLDLPGLEGVDRNQGFDAGAKVLQTVAERLRTAVRTTDWAGRFSERQFLVVLPSCGQARVSSVAARLAQVVQEGIVAAGTPTAFSEVRCSSSVAEPGQEDVDQFLAQVRGE